jgi:hypothetical protein
MGFMTVRIDFHRLHLGALVGCILLAGSLCSAAPEKEPEKPQRFLEVVCKDASLGSVVQFNWAAHQFEKPDQSSVPKSCSASVREWLIQYELDWMALSKMERGIVGCLAAKNAGCALSPNGVRYPEREKAPGSKKKRKSPSTGVVFELSLESWEAIEKTGFSILLRDQNGWPLFRRGLKSTGQGLFLRWGEPLPPRDLKDESKRARKRRLKGWVRVPLKHLKSNVFQLDRSVWLALRRRLPSLEREGLLWLSSVIPPKKRRAKRARK